MFGRWSDDSWTMVGWSVGSSDLWTVGQGDGRRHGRRFGWSDRQTVGRLGDRRGALPDGRILGWTVGRSGGGLEVRKVAVRRWERQWAGSDGWCGDWMGSRTPGQCGNRTSHPMVGRSDGRTIRWMAVYSAVGWVGRLDGGSDDWTVGRSAIDVTDNLGLAPSSKELTENMMSCCGQRPAS